MIEVPSGQAGRGSAKADLRTAIAAAAAVAAAAAAIRLLDPERVNWLKSGLIVFGSLVAQALPFVLIGALASAFIEVLVPPSSLERLAAFPSWLQLPAAGLAGVAFPICECGSVPVARRLIDKGLKPGAAITFMLAAPVLNPVVVASTYVAFRSRPNLWTMVIGRFALGFLVAIAVGWVIGDRAKANVLRSRPSGPQPVSLGEPEPKSRAFFAHLGNDFLFMVRFLLLGAVAAALVQSFVPASALQRVATTQILDILVMMGLAVVLSLCSESDAFIAASFVQFGSAAQLAFLVFGPMVDLKLGALYLGTFEGRTVRAMIAAISACVFLAAIWIRVVAR